MMRRLVLLLLPVSAFCAAPILNITFPASGDTVNAPRVRISGYSERGATVTVNDRLMDLTARGAFVTRVDLVEGWNRIVVEARKNGDVARRDIEIFRPPTSALPETPTRIDTTACRPRGNVWLSEGDFLTVEMKGSPGGKAFLTIEKVKKHLPMVEIDSTQTGGIRGIYRGTLRITSDIPWEKPLTITAELRGRDGRKQNAELGRLTVLSPHIPLIGKTVRPLIVHGSAERYLPLLRLPEGVELHIVGLYQKRYAVRLAERRTGFVDADGIVLLPEGTPLPHAAVGAPRISQDRQWIRLTFPVDRPVPALAEKDLTSNRYDLLFFGAEQASHWITYPAGELDLTALVFSQPEERLFRASMTVQQKRSWGWKVEYEEGAIVWAVRRGPSINPQNPLQGIVVAVDAGHGGDDTGAVSPLGVLEKDVNLRWARLLANHLKRAGAQPFLTRDEDVAVPLLERVRRAEAAEALIFLSLHNNSVPPSGNAAIAEGTSTYFTQPESKELAWTIFPHLVKTGLAPFGRVYNANTVTQSTAFLSVLIEGGFLSHPQEEIRLADEGFLDRLARAVCDGLAEFLAAQAR